jgi:hypothetical protein
MVKAVAWLIGVMPALVKTKQEGDMQAILKP